MVQCRSRAVADDLADGLLRRSPAPSGPKNVEHLFSLRPQPNVALRSRHHAALRTSRMLRLPQVKPLLAWNDRAGGRAGGQQAGAPRDRSAFGERKKNKSIPKRCRCYLRDGGCGRGGGLVGDGGLRGHELGRPK